jgi:hypothetical protein
VAGICFALGFAFLVARLIGGYQAPPGVPRLLFFAVGFGSAMNITLAIFLLVRRYSLSDLGIRFVAFDI